MFNPALGASGGYPAIFEPSGLETMSPPYAVALDPWQNEHLKTILERPITLTSKDPQDPQIQFSLREFVTHIFEKGFYPVLIGGAAQSFFTNAPFGDVDLAVFFPCKPHPDYFTDVCTSFFALKVPSIRVEEIKKYVNWNILHQSMETKELDFKFMSLETDLTHLFDHDALCINLEQNPKCPIFGVASLVPNARMGVDSKSFYSAMEALKTKKLRLTTPEFASKTLLRIVGALTRGFTPEFSVLEHLKSELLSSQYSPETFRRTLNFFLEGHVTEQQKPLFIANLLTVLKQMEGRGGAKRMCDCIEAEWGKDFACRLLVESLLRPGCDSFDKDTIFLEHGALIRSKEEMIEVEEFLSGQENRWEILIALKEHRYPYVKEILKNLRHKKILSLEESLGFFNREILQDSEAKKRRLFRRVKENFLEKGEDVFPDLEKAIILIQQNAHPTPLDPSFLNLASHIEPFCKEPSFLEDIQKKISLSCDKEKLDFKQRFALLEKGFIPLEQGLNEIRLGLVDPSLQEKAYFLFDQLCLKDKSSVMQEIFLENDEKHLMLFGKEQILEVLSTWQSGLFVTDRGELHPILEREQAFRELALEMLFTDVLKKNKSCVMASQKFAPPLKKELLFFNEAFKTFPQKEMEEILSKIPLALFHPREILDLFMHLTKGKKRIEGIAIGLLENLIERHSEEMQYPELFERLGLELLAFNELPIESCKRVLDLYLNEDHKGCPDWIKAVFLRFFASKSGASTPLSILERFASQKPLSSPFVEAITPYKSSFFTRSCRSLISSTPCELTIDQIYRFCSINQKEAVASFKEILFQTATHKNVSSKLFDLLAFAEQIGEVSFPISVNCYEVLARFIKEGFEQGEHYSYDQVFEPIAQSLVKSAPFFRQNPASGQNLRRIFSLIIPAVYDPKDFRLCAWFHSHKELFNLEIGDTEYPRYLDSLLVTLEDHVNFIDILTGMYGKLKKNKISGDALVALGLMVQRIEFLLKSLPAEESRVQALSLVECLGNLYMNVVLIHQSLDPQITPLYLNRLMDTFRNILSTVTSYGLHQLDPRLHQEDAVKIFSASMVGIFHLILEIQSAEAVLNEKEMFLNPFEAAMQLALHLPERESLAMVETSCCGALGIFDEICWTQEDPKKREFFSHFAKKLENLTRIFRKLPKGELKTAYRDFLSSYGSLLSKWRNITPNLALKEQIKGEYRKILEWIKLLNEKI